MTHLTPQQCAEQFEHYSEAASQAQQAANRSNRWDDENYHEGKSKAYDHAAEFLMENAVLRWSKTKPTQPGWYWSRQPPLKAGMPVYLRIENGELVWYEDGMVYRLALSSCEWAGPLQSPIEQETPSP